MKRLIGWLGLSLFLTFNVAAAEWLELFSVDGRKIEAKVIMATEELAEIEVRNGRRFTLPIDRFSLSSREAIRKAAAGDAKEPENPEPPEEGPEEPVEVEVEAPENLPVKIRFEFSGVDFRVKQEKHFRFHTEKAKVGKMDRTASAALATLAPRLPTLFSLFTEKKFRAPGQGLNQFDFDDKGHFRYDIYMVGESDVYQDLVMQYANSLEEENERVFLRSTAPELGQFTDLDHRFSVILYDEQTEMNGLLAHQLGFQFVGMVSGARHLPLWLRMGSGYWVEQQLFGKCSVYYVDFEAYGENTYEDDEAAKGGVMTEKESLDHDKSWVPVLKRMAKKGLPTGLERMLVMQTNDLTPVEAAMSIPLFAFLTSSEERVEIFQKVLKRVGENDDPGAEEMAKMYGFESIAAFEEALLEFMKSKRFK